MARNPEWLPQVREFCRQAGINIMAWGQQALVVEARSAEAATQIAHQLSSFGFTAVEDPADAETGMLTLSMRR